MRNIMLLSPVIVIALFIAVLAVAAHVNNDCSKTLHYGYASDYTKCSK